MYWMCVALSKETRTAVEGTLSRRLSMRPTKEELQQRNILRSETPHGDIVDVTINNVL